ncbi:putative invertase inhibitor [Cornus florida]|uniref:putative invertase inhibitor n=1 Tax=Cornus florida TaxID=4283 RepID=UPI0028991D93|nr:putative invertase inhibitor [Cornus florida]
MKPASCFFSLFLFFFTFHVITTSSLNLNSIYDTCKICAKDEPNPNEKLSLCKTSIDESIKHLNQEEKAEVTRRFVGKNITRILKSNVNETMKHIQGLLGNKKVNNNAAMTTCLQNCLELHKDVAKPSMGKVLKYLQTKNYQEAMVEISAVMNVPIVCEDGFKDMNGLASPLANRNGRTFQLGSLALCFLDVIQGEKALN